MSVAAADVAIRPGFLWRPDSASPSHEAAGADPSQPHAATAADSNLPRGGVSASEPVFPWTGSVAQQDGGDAAGPGLTADCQDVACVIGHFGGAPGSTFAGAAPCAERSSHCCRSHHSTGYVDMSMCVSAAVIPLSCGSSCAGWHRRQNRKHVHMTSCATGVFDGHGTHGRAAAEFAAAQLPRQLTQDRRLTGRRVSRQLKARWSPCAEARRKAPSVQQTNELQDRLLDRRQRMNSIRYAWSSDCFHACICTPPGVSAWVTCCTCVTCNGGCTAAQHVAHHIVSVF